MTPVMRKSITRAGKVRKKEKVRISKIMVGLKNWKKYGEKAKTGSGRS